MAELSWQHRYYALLAETQALRIDEVLAENKRHQRANLVCAVIHGYDEYVTEIINDVGFDKVPWMVAEKTAAEARRLRKALQALVDATKHAPHAERWADPSTFYSARDAAVRLLGGDE